MQSDTKIVQYCTGRHHSAAEVRNAESLKVLGLEMLCKLLVREFIGESPVIKLKGEILAAETLLKTVSQATFEKDLFRTEIYQELFNIVECTFGNKEFARRYIQKRYSAHRLAEMHSSKEVVLLVVEHIVVYGNTRSDKLGNASLYKFLCKFRVFELVAYCYTLACTHQFRKICVKCMKRKSCHFNGF